MEVMQRLLEKKIISLRKLKPLNQSPVLQSAFLSEKAKRKTLFGRVSFTYGSIITLKATVKPYIHPVFIWNGCMFECNPLKFRRKYGQMYHCVGSRCYNTSECAPAWQDLLIHMQLAINIKSHFQVQTLKCINILNIENAL